VRYKFIPDSNSLFLSYHYELGQWPVPAKEFSLFSWPFIACHIFWYRPCMQCNILLLNPSPNSCILLLTYFNNSDSNIPSLCYLEQRFLLYSSS
jgi:hypothetical protein